MEVKLKCSECGFSIASTTKLRKAKGRCPQCGSEIRLAITKPVWEYDRIYDVLTDPSRTPYANLLRPIPFFLSDIFAPTVMATKEKKGLKLAATVSSKSDLYANTRRFILISDSLLLMASPQLPSDKIDYISKKDVVSSVAWHEAQGQWMRYSQRIEGMDLVKHFARVKNTEPVGWANLPDRAVAEWLQEAKPLVKDGRVVYLPGFSRSKTKSVFPFLWIPEFRLATELETMFFDNSGGLSYLTKTAGALLKLDLPYIDGAKLSEIAKLAQDESEAFDRLKTFLLGGLQKITNVADASQRKVAMREVQGELDDGLHSLDARLQRLKRKGTIAAISGILGSLSIVILGMAGEEILRLVAAGLGGGGLGGLATTWSQYRNELDMLRDDKVYFLWRLARISTN